MWLISKPLKHEIMLLIYLWLFNSVDRHDMHVSQNAYCAEDCRT